jgi:hypothetical protein
MKNKDFKENIKVDENVLKAVENVSKIYKEQCRVLEQEDKEKLIRYLTNIDKEVKKER